MRFGEYKADKTAQNFEQKIIVKVQEKSYVN